MDALEALDLLLDLVGRVAGIFLSAMTFAVGVDLLGDLLALAELVLDRLHLLAQEVLALRLVDLVARLRGDLLLHRQHGDLLGEAVVDQLQALDRVGRLEDRSAPPRP